MLRSDHFTQLCIQIIDRLTYLALSILGLYFIVEGNVIQNFQSGKTNYAQYSETITELPTIVTFIDRQIFNLQDPPKYKYGIDFNISVGEWIWNGPGIDFNISVGKSMWNATENPISTNLTFGKNVLGSGPLAVEFEEIGTGDFFKITPVNFSPGMSMSHVIRYTFIKEATDVNVGAILSAENNSVPVPFDFKRFDGNINLMKLAQGEMGFVTIVPTKTKFLSESEECRKKPHNEIMLGKLAEMIQMGSDASY